MRRGLPGSSRPRSPCDRSHRSYGRANRARRPRRRDADRSCWPGPRVRRRAFVLRDRSLLSLRLLWAEVGKWRSRSSVAGGGRQLYGHSPDLTVRRPSARWRWAAPSETVKRLSLAVSNACKASVDSPTGHPLTPPSMTSAIDPSRRAEHAVLPGAATCRDLFLPRSSAPRLARGVVLHSPGMPYRSERHRFSGVAFQPQGFP